MGTNKNVAAAAGAVAKRLGSNTSAKAHNRSFFHMYFINQYLPFFSQHLLRRIRNKVRFLAMDSSRSKADRPSLFTREFHPLYF